MAGRLNYGIMLFPRDVSETRRVAERAEAGALVDALGEALRVRAGAGTEGGTG